MSTIGYFDNLEEFKKLHALPVRTTIESAFYGNNVVRVNDVAEAYELAKKSAGTVELTGLPVCHNAELGLPEGANVLLFNDGAVFGRTAAARRIVGWPEVDVKKICTILREAIHNARERKFYTADAIIGLDEDFMTRAHIMLPEGHGRRAD